MSAPVDDRNLWHARLVRFAALLPPIAILFLISRYAVNVPHHDEWDWSVKHVLAGDLTRFDLGKFWNLNNEHRVFVPKLFATALAHLTNLDMRAGIYAKLFFTLAIAAIFVSLYGRSNRVAQRSSATIVVPLLVSVCLFNLAQWPRWVDVRPLPSTFSILGLAGALWFLSTGAPSRKRFFAAAGCAWISSSSYFSGNITWLVAGLTMIVLGWNRRAVLAWFTLTTAVGVQYAMDFMNTPTATSSKAAPSVGDLFEFTLVFLGSICSTAHRALPNQLEAAVYGGLGICAAAALGFYAHKHLENGLQRAAPWLAVVLWTVINACAAGYGRIPSAGIIGARAWRYSVFGGLFWAAIAVLAATVLLEPRRSTAPEGRRLAFGSLALTLLGLFGGILGMLQSGGLEAYPNNMQAGRAALLLDESRQAAELDFIVPDLKRFQKRLPGLISRRASFLYGEQSWTLQDSKRHGAVSFSRRTLGGERRTVFSLPQRSSIGWDFKVLDRPVVQACFGLSSLEPNIPAQLSVLLRCEGETTTLLSTKSAAAIRSPETYELDLRDWIGKDVTLRFRCDSESARSALLISPRLIYDVLQRDPQ